jgi:enoyl-CoA hydratase/carnithine racemase
VPQRDLGEYDLGRFSLSYGEPQNRIVLSFSEVRVGVIPAMISVVVLPKIGIHHGMRLFLTGETFTAPRALGFNLLHRVVPEAELVSEVEKGAKLPGLYPMNEEAKARYEAWKKTR